MSDENGERRDPASGPAAPDDTRPFSPLGDEGPVVDDQDATRVAQNHPDGDPRSSDAWVLDPEDTRPGAAPTEQLPRADDSTAVTPPRDATAIMPPVTGEPGWGAADAPWSGRAEVRPPRLDEHA